LGAQHALPTETEQHKPGGKAGPGILGVNIGKNKTSEDTVVDYMVLFFFLFVTFNMYRIILISIGHIVYI
jgi:hypothetical protein